MTNDLDLVLVDTGSGISDAVTYFTSAAQEIVVVVTPELASITDAYALIKVLASVHGRKRFAILANNVVDHAQAWRLFDTLSGTALRFLNASLDFLGWIPRDPQLLRAMAQARTVVTRGAGCAIEPGVCHAGRAVYPYGRPQQGQRQHAIFLTPHARSGGRRHDESQ